MRRWTPTPTTSTSDPLLDRLVESAAGPEVELHVADLDDAFGVYERHLEAAELPAEQRRSIRRQLVSMRNTQADVNHLVGWAIRTFLATHRYSDAEIATILDRALSLEINDLLFYLGSPKAPPSSGDTEMLEFIFGVVQTDFVYLGFDAYDGRGGMAGAAAYAACLSRPHAPGRSRPWNGGRDGI